MSGARDGDDGDTWSANNIGVERAVGRADRSERFEIRENQLLSHFFSSRTTASHLSFEMAISKSWRFGIIRRRFDGRRSGSIFRLAPLQFYWNSLILTYLLYFLPVVVVVLATATASNSYPPQLYTSLVED